jgi:inositol-hexakisphosphate/diphosphoinositol-pentakisphosphate 1-kinase
MQTPVLVSLVKKDAAMLDAFGKGASEDIRKTKEELYRKLTQDPATGEIHCKLEKPNGEKTVQRSLPVSPNRVRVSSPPTPFTL